MDPDEIIKAVEYLRDMTPYKMECAFRNSGYYGMKSETVKLEDIRLIKDKLEAVYEVTWLNDDMQLELTRNFVVFDGEQYTAEVLGISTLIEG